MPSGVIKYKRARCQFFQQSEVDVNIAAVNMFSENRNIHTAKFFFPRDHPKLFRFEIYQLNCCNIDSFVLQANRIINFIYSINKHNVQKNWPIRITVVVLIELDDSVKERIYNCTRQTCPMEISPLKLEEKEKDHLYWILLFPLYENLFVDCLLSIRNENGE
jgi:hypothetical protein